MTTNAYGYEKIAKVETQTWTDEYDRVEYAIVWVVTDEGDVFQRALQTGEDLEAVAELLRKRGWTDDHCIFFRAADDTLTRVREAMEV